jgi:hypothetical protein
VTSTVAHGCYQMAKIAMGKDMMSAKTVATEGHNSDGWFGDITNEPLSKRVTRCLLLKSDPMSLQRCFEIVI